MSAVGTPHRKLDASSFATPPKSQPGGLQGTDVGEARTVFEEDVNAFIEDQLRLACRLALAEEQLLSIAHSFKNSMSAKSQSQQSWLDELNLIGSIEDVRVTTQSVNAELGSSLGKISRHSKILNGTRNQAGQAEGNEGQQGGGLHLHLSAFHEDSSVERNARADLQAQFSDFQTEMRLQIDQRMQMLEQGLGQQFSELQHAYESLRQAHDSNVCALERRILETQLVSRSGLAEGDSPTASLQALETLRDTVKIQVLEELSEKIHHSLQIQVRSQIVEIMSQHDAHFQESIADLRIETERKDKLVEGNIRVQEGRLREVFELLELQMPRASCANSSVDELESLHGQTCNATFGSAFPSTVALQQSAQRNSFPGKMQHGFHIQAGTFSSIKKEPPQSQQDSSIPPPLTFIPIVSGSSVTLSAVSTAAPQSVKNSPSTSKAVAPSVQNSLSTPKAGAKSGSLKGVAGSPLPKPAKILSVRTNSPRAVHLTELPEADRRNSAVQ